MWICQGGIVQLYFWAVSHLVLEKLRFSLKAQTFLNIIYPLFSVGMIFKNYNIGRTSTEELLKTVLCFSFTVWFHAWFLNSFPCYSTWILSSWKKQPVFVGEFVLDKTISKIKYICLALVFNIFLHSIHVLTLFKVFLSINLFSCISYNRE